LRWIVAVNDLAISGGRGKGGGNDSSIWLALFLPYNRKYNAIILVMGLAIFETHAILHYAHPRIVFILLQDFEDNELSPEPLPIFRELSQKVLYCLMLRASKIGKGFEPGIIF
jgi:hypothetical protein